MTNEEKANEIASRYMNSILYIETERTALEMAEWKDEQAKESFKKFYDKGLELGKSIAKQKFKEYLEKKKYEIEQGILHSNPLIDGDRWCGRADIINEIINKLFKEDEK